MSLIRRHASLVSIGVTLAAGALIAAAWFGAFAAIDAERQQTMLRLQADTANQALAFGSQMQRQLLVFDQTLRILKQDWEGGPANFRLPAWRERLVALGDLASGVFVADESGRIRSSTRPEMAGLDISPQAYFREVLAIVPAAERTLLSAPLRSRPGGPWQMVMSRRLDHPDGSFAGVIGLTLDLAALERMFRQVDLGPLGLIGLIGGDGTVVAMAAPVAVPPGTSLRDSRLFAALSGAGSGSWSGPSAPDGLVRIIAFRAIPEWHLHLVAGQDEASALGPSVAWAREAQVFAAGLSLLVLLMAGLLLREAAASRQREERLDHDRSELAAANAELEAARTRADAKTAQLEITIAGMSDGVSMLDADLRLLHWNDRYPEFTGAPAAMLRPGVSMAEIIRAQAEAGEFGAVPVAEEVAKRMARLNTPVKVQIIERQRPNGRTVELRRARLADGGMVTLYTDITARKQTEEALLRAREAAEAATEAKSRFVAMVSHEIRTPLNTLLNSLTLLTQSSLTPAQRRLVDLSGEAGDVLLGLLEDILEMSKLEAGRLVLRPRSFPLRALLEGVAEMFRAQAAERGLSISVEIATGVPERVLYDPARLRQVLTNLTSNATKYSSTDTGGEEILLRAETCRVGAGTMLRIGVRDPGPAITEADRARLFQPFAQLDRAAEDGSPGFGLGLSICRRLIGLMGGEIGSLATEDGGNEFWMVLPHQEAGAAEAEVLPRASRRLPRSVVLVVDDVASSRAVTATLLRREGHGVATAASGAEALALLASRPFDLVFVDLGMPGMGGLETARRIRVLPPPARFVPIVALTGHVSAEDGAGCVAAGINLLLGKPADPAALLDALARLVWQLSPVRVLPARPADRSAADRPPLDADRLGHLRENLSPATLARLVEECLVDLRLRVPALRHAIAGLRPGPIEEVAHAMAGVAASYGLAALEERLRQVILAARTGDAASAAGAADAIEAELARAGQAIRAAVGFSTE